MKKLIFLPLCAFLALSLAACGGVSSVSAPAASGSGPVSLANPFTDCETLAEAEELAGFSLTAPEQIDPETSTRLIRAVEGHMIELIYQDSAGDEQARIRKAMGEENVSGDYTEYEQQSTLPLDGADVTMKGGDGLVKAAVWTRDGASFSITAADAMTTDAMSALVQAVR